jgi:hypothetical protein
MRAQVVKWFCVGAPMNSTGVVQTQPQRVRPGFREGHEVVLVNGACRDTFGIFPHMREDVKWADLAGRDGGIRSHHVAWN